MAKLFYTLEETAEKLGKDEASITELVSQGKLREFRDHDNKLMFKIQDVDLLSGDSAGSMELDLSDSEPAAAGSDAFELDLDDETSEPKASSGRSASPVGLGSVSSKAGDDLPLELDLDDAPAAKAATPEGSGSGLAMPPSSEGDTFELDLDDAPSAPDASAASASASASQSASGSMSAMVEQAAATDELTLELDLGEEPAAAPTPARGGAKRMDDSIGSVVAAPAAAGGDDDLGLEGSNIGAGSPEGSSIADRIGVEGGSSGSGLMDLTNESESSSIGAALMDEAFSTEEQSELPANASGIFGGEGGESGAGLEAVAAGAAAGAAAAVAGGKAKKGSAPIFTSGPAAPEAYSGSWSGLGIGMLLPAALGLGAAMAMVASKMLGAPADLAVMYAKDWVMYTGGLAGLIAVCGGIGFFVGKATE